MLVRIVNMRGVNLNVFDFDYDLTWVGFFMNANERVYGRYGGRDAGPADARLTLAGLKYAMQQALVTHKREADSQPPAEAKQVVTAEQYPSSRRLKAEQCIHCHMVYGFRRDAEQSRDAWRNETSWEWLPPQPENVGLTMDVNQGNRVLRVGPQSPATRAGLRVGDALQTLNGFNLASIADVQTALQRAPGEGAIPVAWQRGTRTMAGSLQLSNGWKKGDLSWRAFMWGLSPAASVHGKDLTADEKMQLGLAPKQLAFRQGQFVPPAAREAGVRKDDIIIGLDGKVLELTMLQFNAYVRLNFKVGDRVTYNLIRDGKRLEIPIVLPARG